MKKNKKIVSKRRKPAKDIVLSQLKGIFPKADTISVHALYLAIKRGYKFYLTYDPYINNEKEKVLKQFNVHIYTSVDSLPEEAKQELYKKINPMYAAEEGYNGF